MATIYAINSIADPGNKIKYRADAWPDAGNGTDNSNLQVASQQAGDGGTVIIASGEYTGTQLNATSTFYVNYTNQIVRAAVVADGGGHEGLVTLTGDGTNAPLDLRKAGIVATNFKVTNTGGVYAAVNTTASCTLNNCNLMAEYYPIRSTMAAPATITLNRCFVKGNGNKLIAHGGTTLNNILVANNCIFDFANLSTSVIQWSANATLNNCDFRNSYSYVWYTVENNICTILFNNCTINGNSLSVTNTHIIRNDQANITMIGNNCLLLSNSLVPDSYNFSGITLTNCIQTDVPGFVSPKHPGVLVFCIDDMTVTTLAYLAAVKALWEQYEYKGVWAINHTDTILEAAWAAAREFVSDGNEVSCHTRNHWPLATTTTFTIQKADRTITIAGNVFTPDVGDAYDLTLFTLSTLRTQMHADGYNCGADPSSDVSATALADVAPGTSINAAYTLNLNEGRLFKLEIDPSVVDIETNIPGYTCTSFTPPGNSSSANLRSYLAGDAVDGETITTPFLGARGNPTALTNNLDSFDIFQIEIRDSSNTGSTTNWVTGGGSRTDGIKRNVAALCEGLNALGGIVVLYFHSATEFSEDDWRAALSIIKKSNVQVMTLTEAIAYAKTYDPSGDLATGDGVVYTRTLIDASDHHLTVGSPCRNHGKDVGLTSDYEENVVPYGGFPIGPYRGPAVNASMGLNLSLGGGGGRMIPPRRRRR